MDKYVYTLRVKYQLASHTYSNKSRAYTDNVIIKECDRAVHSAKEVTPSANVYVQKSKWIKSYEKQLGVTVFETEADANAKVKEYKSKYGKEKERILKLNSLVGAV